VEATAWSASHHDRDEVGALVFPGAGSSARIARRLVLAEPPSIDAGEIIDKGYLDPRAILGRRTADVARLYSDDPAVILPG